MGALEATDFLLQVCRAMQPALWKFALTKPPIRNLQGDGVGTFSGASGMEPNEVRVIWGKLKHESDQRVREIHTAVERACSRAQGSRSKHDPRFHPHVTLARVKARKNATSEERAWVEEVAEGLVKGECRGAGEFESLVTGVSLMEVGCSGCSDLVVFGRLVYWGQPHRSQDVVMIQECKLMIQSLVILISSSDKDQWRAEDFFLYVVW